MEDWALSLVDCFIRNVLICFEEFGTCDLKMLGSFIMAICSSNQELEEEMVSCRSQEESKQSSGVC